MGNNEMTRFLHKICAVVLLVAHASGWAATLTDITLFSTNELGHNWLGWIWNTQGSDTDAPNRWNLYISEDPLSETSPQFLNHFNDENARVAIDLQPGTHVFSIYGEGLGDVSSYDPPLHFVLNLYFGGDQAAPLISGLQNTANSALQPAGHPNGLDLFGNDSHAEAGVLSAQIGDQQVTLTEFSWIINGTSDVVWQHWANDPVYSNGSGTADYYGSFTLQVTQVPEPTPPTFSKSFSPANIPVGQNSTLSFTIDNSASASPATDLNFTDQLPASITVASPANAMTTCKGGTITAASGTNVISYSGGIVDAASSCTLSVDVNAASAGEAVNTTGDLTSSGGNSGPASASLNVAQQTTQTRPVPTTPVYALVLTILGLLLVAHRRL